MKNVKLSNGVEMPILGFGVYQIPDEAECTSAVTGALEVGYRSFDTAAVYRNEGAVGAAIASSGIAREELFITSKLWVDQAGETETLRAYDLALSKLGLEYLDLYLIHQPFGDLHGAWRALERL
jgi:diketogulonate reductase-like aldo/keto reductase